MNCQSMINHTLLIFFTMMRFQIGNQLVEVVENMKKLSCKTNFI